ncbi:MAG: riboflavin-specific deaminase [Gammaproteobacteria bacterium]|nr:riboflavin-specific deaminase [Gammaproteobacteria bacterium]
MDRSGHEPFMRAALLEGRKAYPACAPNPPVGCVIVIGEAIVACGFTQPPFEHHAEPMALEQLDGPLESATMYVTLEPCAFHQRTPSCAAEILRRRVGRVFAAMLDPHPRNRGAGIEMLRAGGIPTEVGLLETEAARDLGSHSWKPETP